MSSFKRQAAFSQHHVVQREKSKEALAEGTHSPVFAGASDVAIRCLGFFFGNFHRGFQKLKNFCFFAACRDLTKNEPRQREAPLCTQKCKKARQKTQGKPLLGVLCSRLLFLARFSLKSPVQTTGSDLSTRPLLEHARVLLE